LTAGGEVLTIGRISEGVAFWIHVTPRARRPAVAGCHGDALRVTVAAPPANGLANAACVRALAEALGVKRSAVELDPGSRGRRKRVQVTGDPDALAARLKALATSSGSQ
jgi:uncharacterized protein (TIGR00251 family)